MLEKPHHITDKLPNFVLRTMKRANKKKIRATLMLFNIIKRNDYSGVNSCFTGNILQTYYYLQWKSKLCNQNIIRLCNTTVTQRLTVVPILRTSTISFTVCFL